MRLPTYDEVARNEDQLDVYETPLDESAFVVGPPGSGKTVLAIHRSMMLVDANVTVVFITFNRMLRRLAYQLANKPFLAKTMHAFVSGHYWNHTHENAPEITQYIYDWSKMLRKLKRLSINTESMHLVVDEGQDLPPEFYRYVVNHVTSTITVFADEDQTLTKQRSTLNQIKSETGLDNPFILNGNHRNTPEVARVAQHFYVGSVPVPTIHRDPSGELPRIDFYSDIEKAANRIANWYSTRGRRIGVVVERNDTGSRLQKILKQLLRQERVDMYCSQKRNEDTIDLLTPGITVLNEKSIKGQQFPVLVCSVSPCQ